MFGFSPYVLGQAVAQHLNLVMVWPIPLLALVALRFCRGQISSRRATVTSAALGLFLFGTSLELFATSVVIGGIVLVIALLFDRELRRRLLLLARALAISLAIIVVLMAPLVWLMLTERRPPLPFPPEQYATDLANLLVPTPLTIGGTTSFARAISGRFVGNLGEQDGYLGVPLIAVCIVAAWRDWGRRAWIAVSALVVGLIFSLGPALVIGGHTIADIPVAMDRVPMLALALPSRLAVFVTLAAVCLAVRWLARPERARGRVLVGLVIAVSLMPQLGALTRPSAEASADRAGQPAFAWEMPRAASSFVGVANRFSPHTTVLALPFGGRSPVTFWQAETDMGFRTAGGYTPFAPPAAATDPMVVGFLQDTAPPLAVLRLRAYLVRTHTTIVLVQPSARIWNRIVRAATHVRPRRMAGTDVFTIDARRLHALLVRPPAPRRPIHGIAISSGGTPLASLTAAGGSRSSVAAWLTYDWRTGHVIAQASVRLARWSRAVTLSDPQLEASALNVATAGRHSIISWIEARDGKAVLRVEEFRRGSWHRVGIAHPDAVTLDDGVALASNGVATVAWTAQNGARTLLRALRISADGRFSSLVDLSSPQHSVDGFSIAATAREQIVAWRERDATQATVYASTLDARARTWGRAVALSADNNPSAPIVRISPHGAVVVWLRHTFKADGLVARRLDSRGLPGAPITLVVGRHGRTIATPSASATPGGTLVAWCAMSGRHGELNVALIAQSRVSPARRLAECGHRAPHLLAAGTSTLVNGAAADDLYLLTATLQCSVLHLRPTGAYRLLAGPAMLEQVTGSAFPDNTVVVHKLGSPGLHRRTCP